MSTRRRTVSFVPSTPDVPSSEPLEELRVTSNPQELQNIDELRRKTLAKLYTATGYKADDDWFETREVLGQQETVLTRGKQVQVSLAPTAQQLGLIKTIPKSETRLDDEVNSTTEDARRFEDKTFAVMNHPLMQYTGSQSSGMGIIAVTGASAILIASAALAVFLNLVTKPAPTGRGLLRNIPRDLGFPESNFPVGVCINRGIPILLGLGVRITNASSIPGVLGQLLGALGSSVVGGSSRVPLSESPGFYAHLFRTVVQGVEELQKATSKLQSQPTNIGNYRAFVDSIKSLGLIRFLALAATLGHEILKREREVTEGNLDNVSLPPEGRFGFRGLEGKDRIGRSRLGDGDKGGKRMSNSLRDMPSAFLPPTTVRNVQNHVSIADKYIPKLAGNETNARVLKALRNELEKEHVPFWIQDMRTGEVAAFHAFLLSVNDNFSPSVEGTSTLGRMDDVLTLNKTTRTVSCEFYIVATSPDEHDYLWHLVNWLTMLIYPTWSEGIKVNETRTSPFGRVPSASPLVRIRLGDVWKSNAGSESISRLLVPEEQLRNKWSETNKDWDSDVEPLARAARNNSWEFARGGEYTLFPNPLGYAYDTNNSLANLRDLRRGSEGNLNARTLANAIKDNNGRVLKTYENLIFVCENVDGENASGNVYAVNPDGTRGERISSFGSETFLIKVTRRDVQPRLQSVKRLERTAQAILNTAASAASALGALPVPIPGSEAVGAVARTTSRLAEKPRNVANGLQALTNRAENPGIESLPFVQALRKGSLDGLAGMITTFDLDYNWVDSSSFALETNRGSVAPIGVKINIGMNVIHDIQPGRDALGNNRAPIFPVGRAMNDSIGRFYDDFFYDEERDSKNKFLESGRASVVEKLPTALSSALGVSTGESNASPEEVFSEPIPRGDGRKPLGS
jgi:hypothetical protein